jgi:NADPH2:quinone reductase
MPADLKSIWVRSFGAPETYELVAGPAPAPGPGQVRIAVHAAGVGFVDLLVAQGQYQLKPPLPFVPGSECAGEIEAVGAGVESLYVGQRVCGAAFTGAFGQSVILPAQAVLAIPHGMGFEEASVFRVSYLTAYYALKQRGRLNAGETLLVLGAGGAVGYAAVQLGKTFGAKVIASASSPDKRALATLGGADLCVDAASATWRDEVKSLNDGRPIDVVLDPVGGAATEVAFRALAWNGRLLAVGFASGSIAKIPANLALLKGAALIGVDVRQFGEREPDVAAANIAEIFALHAKGSIKPAIAGTYPLEEFAAAMRAAQSGRSAGRIVIKMR